MWWLLLATVAGAADVRVITPDGPAQSGRTTRLHVVVVDDAGTPLPNPELVVDQGAALPLSDPTLAAGVHGWLWTPPMGATSATLTVTAQGRSHTVTLPVQPRKSLDLGLPSRLDAQAGTQLLLRLTGADRPTAADLEVTTSEVAQVELRETAAALEVRLQPSGVGARAMTVALRDRRRDATPQVVRVRLYDRQRRTFDLEPGATLKIRLGDREYGPFVASESGRVVGVLDQWPGEQQAQLVVTDDLGNELVTAYVLSSRSAPELLLVQDGSPMAGARPPSLLALASSSDGRPWKGGPPICQIPGIGEAATTNIGGGVFVVGVPATGTPSGGMRISCALGEAKANLRLAPEPGVPTAVQLRVWPEQVSLDFPVAEVTVHLVDGAGERLSADGVQVSALLGAVKLEPGSGGSRRGEYKGGSEAIAEGQDRVMAGWTAPIGAGAATGVQVGHGVVPRVGSVSVYGRALDKQGRALAGVSVRLGVDDRVIDVVSGIDGWATAEIAAPATLGALSVSAGAGEWRASRLVPRGAEASATGPGRPDLSAESTVSLTTGRVSVVNVSTDTPVLYLAPNAQLDLRIRLTDRAGQPVTQEVPVVSADHGNVGALRPHPDGGFAATYTPAGDRRARTVTIVARSPSGPASGSTRIRLEFPPMTAAVGVSAGAITNLGQLNSATFSVDGDVRLPLDPLFLRVGMGGYAVAKTVSTEFGDVDKRLTVLPVTLAALARQDRGRNAGWLGLGVALAPYYASEVFEGNRRPPRQGLLTPGISAMVGGGRRIGSGELIVELRGLVLVGSSGSGFTGQVGGIGAVLGYRFVID